MAVEVVESRIDAFDGATIVFRRWPKGGVYLLASPKGEAGKWVKLNLDNLRELAEVATKLAQIKAQLEAEEASA